VGAGDAILVTHGTRAKVRQVFGCAPNSESGTRARGERTLLDVPLFVRIRSAASC
jgi:hypothetical protein